MYSIICFYQSILINNSIKTLVESVESVICILNLYPSEIKIKLILF